MKTTTSVKSGGFRYNHNQSLAGVRVQSNVKAGPIEIRELVIKVNVNEPQR